MFLPNIDLLIIIWFQLLTISLELLDWSFLLSNTKFLIFGPHFQQIILFSNLWNFKFLILNSFWFIFNRGINFLDHFFLYLRRLRTLPHFINLFLQCWYYWFQSCYLIFKTFNFLLIFFFSNLLLNQNFFEICLLTFFFLNTFINFHYWFKAMRRTCVKVLYFNFFGGFWRKNNLAFLHHHYCIIALITL